MSNLSLSNDQHLPTNPSVTDRINKKDEKECRYEQLFSPYHPSKSYVLYFINSLTTEAELKMLCNVIKGATDFIFDTESDIRSYTPALIQVLIVQEDPEPSLVLLIETTHLPDISSNRFREIQNLFYHLFRIGTNLYSWGPLVDELERFQIYQLFSISIPSNVFNVQRIFTGWFNEHINMKPDDNNNTTDYDDSIVINAPQFDPELFLPPTMMNHLKIINNQLWSLQDAIAYIFYQYLSKRETLRSWAIGLDKRLPSRDKNYSLNYRKRLIKYASYDCLSLMEIILFMYENYLSNHPVNDLHIQSLGEYFSYLNTKFITSSSLVKTRQVYEILIDDESEDSMTVHDLNERHPISFEHQTSYDVNPNQQTLEQDFDIYQQQQEIEFYVPHDQHLTTDQYVNDHESYSEPNSPQELNHYHQQNDYYQAVEIDHHVQENNLIVISNSLRKPKSKRKRSRVAQQRRNHQSNIRRRRHRYKFEVIRPLNTTITHVKQILHSYAVPYINVNPVQSTLYIDLRSKDLQDYFEQLLPMDLFL
ncbi:unnamed protein product [Rotaria sp. Silwood1]|nr:unnamed protein product [Rotaria sp. Silwood1]